MGRYSWMPTVLTCAAAAGVVGTAVLTAKATPKALDLLHRAEEEKQEELTLVEKIKVTAPAYIPAILAGASTIICIFGANGLNKKQQASLASAYALLDRSYREYVEKTKEMYGEESDAYVRQEIVKDHNEELEFDIPEDEQLFFDFNSYQYFTAKIGDVIQKTVTDDGLECYILSTPFDTIPKFI